MNYCIECGTKLVLKQCKKEGMIPFCEACEQFRFPIFSTAISTVVVNRTKDKIALIKQYGGQHFVLVAGYINRGEGAEQALIREVKEEIGATVISHDFMKSSYFKPSNTLMLNFISVVEDESLHIAQGEVDAAQWFSISDAAKAICPDSLAQYFLSAAIEKLQKSKREEVSFL